MKNKKRPVFAAVAAAMLASSSMPARADSSSTGILFGLLAVLAGTLGYVAYEHDTGKDNKPLVAPDQTDHDKKKDGAHIQIVAPPSPDDEARPNEFAAGLAFTKRF